MKRQQVWRSVVVACAAMAVFTSTPAHAQLPAVLDQAPADAQVVIVVPNMKQLSDKLANLQRQLQIPVPEMADLLAEFKRESGMEQGLKDDGAAMIVLGDLGPMIREEVGEPPGVVLMEVSDYGQFVGNFGGKADDAVTALQMPGGEPGFARPLGSFAVFGPDRAIVEAYAAGKAANRMAELAGKFGQTYLGQSDAFVYVDLQALAPALRPKIQQAMDQVKQMARGEGGEQAAMMMGLVNLYGSALDTILEDGQALTFGVDFSDGGIGLTKTIQARPGSTMASYFPGPGAQGGAASMLKALPNQPYLFATAMDTRAIDLAKILTRFQAAVGDGGGWIARLYGDMGPMMKLTEGYAQAWYAPTQMAAMGPGLMNVVSVYDTTDGPAYAAATKKYFENLNGVNVAMGPDMGQMSFATSYTPAATKVEGVDVDQYNMAMTLPPELMAEMGPAAGVLMMMGGLNYQGYLATRGDKVIMTTGLDQPTLAAALKSVDAPGGLGDDPGIKQARDQALPQPLAMEVHFSPSGFLATANTFMQMFGQQALPAGDGLPPISMGLGVQDSGVAGRFYLPIASLKGIIEAAEAAQRNMGGMQQDQGGGPPPF